MRNALPGLAHGGCRTWRKNVLGLQRTYGPRKSFATSRKRKRRRFYAEGVTAISLWLSAATPPVHDRSKQNDPGGVVASFRLRRVEATERFPGFLGTFAAATPPGS